MPRLRSRRKHKVANNRVSRRLREGGDGATCRSQAERPAHSKHVKRCRRTLATYTVHDICYVRWLKN